MLIRLLRLVHRSRRSLRDLCYTLVVLAGASALLTYHISRYLPSRGGGASSSDASGTSSRPLLPPSRPNGHMLRSRDGSTGYLHIAVDNVAYSGSTSPTSPSVTATKDEAREVLEGVEAGEIFNQWETSVTSSAGVHDDGGDDDEDDEIEEVDLAGEEDEDVAVAAAVTALEEGDTDSFHSTRKGTPVPDDSRTNAQQNDGIQSNKLTEAGTTVKTSACSNDITTLSLLASLDIFPALTLLPSFNATSTSDYYATVQHRVVLIQVVALAAHCNAETRLADRRGPISKSNFTLGLGVNRFNIYIVDTSSQSTSAASDGGSVVGLYTLTVYRQPITGLGRPAPSVANNVVQPLTLGDDFDKTSLAVCSLIQDCELPFLPHKPCGLYRSTRFENWNDFILRTKSLPFCQSGHEPAEWVLPCSDCSDVNSCYWQQAVWQPHKCVYWRLKSHRLKSCMAQKKILFIGDSTNRGIMHYAMETLNGSLTEWDKTHDMQIYSNINDNRTVMSFAYYPQFWLRTGQRPMFDDTLLQLLRVTSPLENSDNTVLVVGGVHWLSTHHIVVIYNLLQSRGLSNVTVVIKTLGAGFHQPVDGIHHLSLKDQQRLVQHNEDVIEQAKLFGFNVVDTFQMTMARYKDFLQGKCACHFHRVKEILPSFSEYLRSTAKRTGAAGDQVADMPIHYHVEGDINAVYSDILLSQICQIFHSRDRSAAFLDRQSAMSASQDDSDVTRRLLRLNDQAFHKEILAKEDSTRLQWWRKTKLSRDAAVAVAAAAAEGTVQQSSAVQVMRKRILDGVPHPSGAFSKVLDMKPADYRRRKPFDHTENRLREVVDRLDLFTDQTLSEPMFPVPRDVRIRLYNGVSHDGQGRADYLKERYNLKPDKKFRFSPSQNQRYGFSFLDFVRTSDIKTAEFVRRRLIADTFYTGNHSGPPGLAHHFRKLHKAVNLTD